MCWHRCSEYANYQTNVVYWFETFEYWKISVTISEYYIESFLISKIIKCTPIVKESNRISILWLKIETSLDTDSACLRVNLTFANCRNINKRSIKYFMPLFVMVTYWSVKNRWAPSRWKAHGALREIYWARNTIIQ